MAAHVTVELTDEPGSDPIATLDPAGGDVGALLPPFDDASYPLLRLVDPYGDTVFSTYQMAGLVPELERLLAANPHPLLGQVLRLAERCRGQPHRYLVFIGD